MKRLRWPAYADGLSVAAIRELHDAAVDYSLQAGAHDGPCDNDGMPYEACSIHVATSEARRERLAQAIKTLERGL